MKADHNKIQLGSDPDPTKNFIIQTPPVQDGTLEIRRGTLEAPGALVATFNEHGLVDPRMWFDLTGQRQFGVEYVNNTGRELKFIVLAQAPAGARLALNIKPSNGPLAGSFIRVSTIPLASTANVSDVVSVPSGDAYQAALLGGSGSETPIQWHEYRLPEGA